MCVGWDKQECRSRLSLFFFSVCVSSFRLPLSCLFFGGSTQRAQGWHACFTILRSWVPIWALAFLCYAISSVWASSQVPHSKNMHVWFINNSRSFHRCLYLYGGLFVPYATRPGGTPLLLSKVWWDRLQFKYKQRGVLCCSSSMWFFPQCCGCETVLQVRPMWYALPLVVNKRIT